MGRACRSCSNGCSRMPPRARTPDTLNLKNLTRTGRVTCHDSARRLDGLDIGGLLALRPHLHFKTDFLVFLQ